MNKWNAAVIRSQRRTLSIQITPEGELVVRAPARLPQREIDRFLDNAVMAGLERVTLIHGKGTGALRTGVQQHLRRHPQVAGFRLGTYGEGETGVTIVELK